jgi:hypothetical protein
MRRVMLYGGHSALDHRVVDCDEHWSEIRQPIIGAATGEFLRLGLPPADPVIVEGVYCDRGKQTLSSPPIPIFEFHSIEYP